MPNKFKHSNDDFENFICYKESKIINWLCMILPQVTGYKRYFEHEGKDMFFAIKDDHVLDKYNEIYYKIKEILNIKFHSMAAYDERYIIKHKVKEFNGAIKTNFLGDRIPKENTYYACITSKIVDSVMRMAKENYPQVYLEEYKHRMKKIKITKFIEAEVESKS